MFIFIASRPLFISFVWYSLASLILSTLHLVYQSVRQSFLFPSTFTCLVSLISCLCLQLTRTQVTLGTGKGAGRGGEGPVSVCPSNLLPLPPFPQSPPLLFSLFFFSLSLSLSLSLSFLPLFNSRMSFISGIYVSRSLYLYLFLLLYLSFCHAFSLSLSLSLSLSVIGQVYIIVI